MALVDLVKDEHPITEAECGTCCSACSTVAGEAILYPCPTVQRAIELEAISPTGA